jgi:hypothetical protein
LSHGAHLGDHHHQIHGSAELGHGADLALVPPRILSSHELDLKTEEFKKTRIIKENVSRGEKKIKDGGRGSREGIGK